MGWFKKLSGDVTGDQSANDCRRGGGHNQSTELRDAGTEAERRVVYCKTCGMEW